MPTASPTICWSWGWGWSVGRPAAASVLGAFAWPFLSGASAWGAEWAGFVARAGSSQFTLLALFDLATCLAMISAAVAGPHGRRREEASAAEAAVRLAPCCVDT